ncbi:coiled-coil domain-containing protein [Oopsacas minuta]|uniref:Coiled-coil domain-containing protein n=1 Tax=Oopsacas minuta TaxID=111878 RepID=A0AAV7KCZ0_9METZ|nr:coiled-coil domain-containing protein [Oopsacas minuta]
MSIGVPKRREHRMGVNDRTFSSDALTQLYDPNQKILILPEHELRRMTNSSLEQRKRKTELAKRRQEEKEALKQKARDIVKKWDNTIEGNRLRKLEARRIQAEKDELERQRLDAEEEKYRSEEKKVVLEKANQLRYFQTDRVKHLHRGLVLSEVLKERHQQVKLKQNIETERARRDDKFIELEKKEREVKELEEKKKKEHRIKEEAACRQEQLKQVQSKLETAESDRAQQLTEQKELDRLAEEYLKEEDLKEQAKRKQMIEYRSELEHQQVKMEEARQAAEQKAIIEENRNAIFVTTKRDMVVKRKAKEKELLGELRNLQDHLIDKLSIHMAQQVDTEDLRIAEAQRQGEEKRQKQEQVKFENREELTKDCKLHAQKVLREQERLQTEEIEKGREELSRRVDADRRFHEQQAKIHLEQIEESKCLQQNLMDQVKFEYEKKQTERDDNKFIADLNYKMLKQEEKQFQNYSTKLIEQVHKENPNIYPLVQAAKSGGGGGHGPIYDGKGGIRPSFQVRDATAIEMPSYIPHNQVPRRGYRRGETQKRLGFNL